MQVTLSGSVVVNLNDTSNYQIQKTWELQTATVKNSQYTNVEEHLDVNVRGTDPRENARNLLQLQEDVAHWQKDRTDPVIMTYTPSDVATEYRTLVTDLKVELPPYYHQINVMAGIPDVQLTLTRKGLFLSSSEGYYTSTSGISGTVFTITGMTNLTALSPTDIRISGLFPSYIGVNQIGLPQGYLIATGRNRANDPAIAYVQGAGLKSTGLATNPNVAIINDGRFETGNVIQVSGTLGPVMVAANIPAAVTTFNTSVISLLNAYERVAMFGVVRNPGSVGAEIRWAIRSAEKGTGVTDDELLYATLGGPVLVPAGMVNPTPLYLGTLYRHPSHKVAALVFYLSTSGIALRIGSLYAVGMTDQTNILKLDATPANLAVYGRSVGLFETNYLRDVSYAGMSTSVDTLPYGAITADNDLYGWSVAGGTLRGTSSPTIDVTCILTTSGAYRYVGPPVTGFNGASGILHIRPGVFREKGHVIPGL